MSDSLDITPAAAITSEACAWVAQLETGNLSASDIAALREWMARSPQHAREIKEIAAHSGDLSLLTEMAEPMVAAIESDLRRPVWRLRTPRLAVAFGAVLAMVFVVVMSVTLISPANTDPAIYKTAIGEIQSIELPDGTIVKLNTASQIEIDFTKKQRRVRLVSGEALFDVAHNPARPFKVYAGETVSEAIGTSFVVRLRNAVTELAVVEGVVAFSNLAQSVRPVDSQVMTSELAEPLSEKRVIVKAGNILTSAQIGEAELATMPVELPVIETREIQRKLSWTEGLFDFSQTPLDEVVAEISRHHDVSIEIVDPDLRALKFGGMFRTGDVDSLLEALEDLGLEVEHAGDNVILLHKAEAS